MLHFLAVVYYTLCIPSLTSSITYSRKARALIILPYAAGYPSCLLLTPVCGILNVKAFLKQDQCIERTKKGQVIVKRTIIIRSSFGATDLRILTCAALADHLQRKTKPKRRYSSYTPDLSVGRQKNIILLCIRSFKIDIINGHYRRSQLITLQLQLLIAGLVSIFFEQ